MTDSLLLKQQECDEVSTISRVALKLELKTRIDNAIAKALAAQHLLGTAGVDPKESAIFLWNAWQEIGAALEIIAGQKSCSMDTTFPLRILVCKEEEMAKLLEICEQYSSDKPIPLSAQAAKRHLRLQKRAINFLKMWYRQIILTPTERFPRFYRRSSRLTAVTGAVLLVAAALVVLTVLKLGKNEGLLGAYYSKENFKGEAIYQVDPKVDFNWSNSSPSKRLPKDNFSIRWEGCVYVEKNESPILAVGSDDGSMLYVNDKLVIDNSGKHVYRMRKASEPLKPGWHYIRLEYTELKLNARVLLAWSKSVTEEPGLIPGERLIPLGKKRDNYNCTKKLSASMDNPTKWR